MAVLKNSALVGYFVPAEAVSQEQHRTASIEEIRHSLKSRKGHHPASAGLPERQMGFLLLSVDHIIAIHDEVLELNELQGMAGDKSLKGPLSKVDNRLKYGLINDIYSLAASYATAISQAHCFNDGNKRTAFQVMDLILDLNSINVTWDVEAVGQKIVLLSQSKLDEADLAQWLWRVNV